MSLSHSVCSLPVELTGYTLRPTLHVSQPLSSLISLLYFIFSCWFYLLKMRCPSAVLWLGSLRRDFPFYSYSTLDQMSPLPALRRGSGEAHFISSSLALHLKRCLGQPGWLSDLAPPSAQGLILETRDCVPCQAPCMGPVSPSASLPLSLSVSPVNK